MSERRPKKIKAGNSTWHRKLTKIVELGGQVKDFIAAANMIIMFDEAMALPELRDACVMHTGNQLTGMIETGDVYKISGAEFKIVKVGSEVQKNLMNLGHITIKFDGGEGTQRDDKLFFSTRFVVTLRRAVFTSA